MNDTQYYSRKKSRLFNEMDEGLKRVVVRESEIQIVAKVYDADTNLFIFTIARTNPSFATMVGMMIDLGLEVTLECNPVKFGKKFGG